MKHNQMTRTTSAILFSVCFLFSADTPVHAAGAKVSSSGTSLEFASISSVSIHAASYSTFSTDKVGLSITGLNDSGEEKSLYLFGSSDTSLVSFPLEACHKAATVAMNNNTKWLLTIVYDSGSSTDTLLQQLDSTSDRGVVCKLSLRE